MENSDIEKLIEDLELMSKDLINKNVNEDDNYDDCQDNILTLIEQLNKIYFSEY